MTLRYYELHPERRVGADVVSPQNHSQNRRDSTATPIAKLFPLPHSLVTMATSRTQPERTRVFLVSGDPDGYGCR
jgi:hypothetical protein